jgi:hemerythrin superfamily protein
MARIDLDLDEMLEGFTRDGMKRFVKKLLMANEAEEKKLLAQLNKSDETEEKNDLADLDEEMHGKPNTPKVEDEEKADG